MKVRRAPKWHHVWCLMSTMPPLKHKETGKSPIIDWIVENGKLDRESARAAFESAKQAKYLVMREGAWHFDAASGFFHWHKPKESATPINTEELKIRNESLEAQVKLLQNQHRLTEKHWKGLERLRQEPPSDLAKAADLVTRATMVPDNTAREIIATLAYHGFTDRSGIPRSLPAEVEMLRPALTPTHLKALAFITAKATETKDAAIAVVEEALGCDTETAKRYLNDLFKHGLVNRDGKAAEAMAEIVAPD